MEVVDQTGGTTEVVRVLDSMKAPPSSWVTEICQDFRLWLSVTPQGRLYTRYGSEHRLPRWEIEPSSFRTVQQTNALYFYYTQEPPAGLFAANCRGFLDPHNPSPFACSKSWRTRPTRPHVLPAVVRLPLPSLLLVLLHQQRRVEAVSLRNNQTQGDGDV